MSVEPIDGVTVPAGLQERLRELAADHYCLTSAGYGWEYDDPAEYEKDRSDLLASASQVAAVMEILRAAPRSLEPEFSSYSLKHLVEHLFEYWAGHYCGHISNGAAIAAAWLSGRVAEGDGPNLLVDVPAAWARDLLRRERVRSERGVRLG